MSWLALLAALLAALAPAIVTAGADASTSPIKCTLTVNGKVLQYTPKYTASEAAGTPLPIKVKTLGKLSYKMHVQPVLGAKSLDVIFVQSQLYHTGNRIYLKAGKAGSGTRVTSVKVSGHPSTWWLYSSSAGRRRLLTADVAHSGSDFVMSVSTSRVPKAFRGFSTLVTATFATSLSAPRTLTCGMRFSFY